MSEDDRYKEKENTNTSRDVLWTKFPTEPPEGSAV